MSSVAPRFVSMAKPAGVGSRAVAVSAEVEG